MVELFGSDTFGVQRHTDLTDKIRDRLCADFGFQSPSADEHSAALWSGRLAQRVQQRELLLKEADLDVPVPPRAQACPPLV